MAKRPVRERPTPTATNPGDTDRPAFIDPPIQITSAVAESPTIKKEEIADTTERTIEVAMRRYRSVCVAEAPDRADMLDDKKFRVGRIGDQVFQWPEGLANDRKLDGRPVLQVNRIDSAVDIARNQGDAANLRIEVHPVDDEGDVDVANVLAGLMRNVETQSFAEDVYSTAGDAQCEMGRGYVWLITEFEGDDSFRQRARLMRVLNPFRVKVDASHQQKDASDAEFSFYDTDLDLDTWKAIYGKNGALEPPTESDVRWTDVGDTPGDWFPSKEKVSVKHYFAAEYSDDRLYELTKPLPDGKTTIRGSEIPAEVERLATAALTRGSILAALTPEELAAAKERFIKKRTVRSRPIKVRTIVWRVMDAKYIHATTTWPTPWQPFIPMIGSESDLDGQRMHWGVVRHGKDPQKVYNVEVSSVAEAINDVGRNTYVGYEGVFGAPNTPMNKAWKDRTTRRLAYLEAKHVDLDGTPAGLPVMSTNEPAIQGIAHALMQADIDLKATTRAHDDTLGITHPNRSGVAIQENKQQDQVSTSHLTANRRHAIASCGRQLIRIFRMIYDVATVVRITGPDDQKKKVMIFNGPENDPRMVVDPVTGERVPDPQFELPKGVREIYDIGTGEYDIEVTSGPKPGTRRQEDLNTMVNFAKLLPPEYMMNFMDLLFKLLDSPVGRQLSERADKMLKPELRDQKDQAGHEIPPEVLMKVKEMQQREGSLIQALKEAQEIVRTKKMELASKEQIETMKRYVELVRLLVTEANTDRRLLLQTEVDRIHAFLGAADARLQQTESEADTASAAPSAPAQG